MEKERSTHRRRRGFRVKPSRLLVANGSGVYSLARRRYIKTTLDRRYRVLCRDLAPITVQYRRLQMSRWPEYDERASWREVTRCKQRLMDAFWEAAPDDCRESAARRYFDEKVRYKYVAAYALLVAFAGFELAWVALLGISFLLTGSWVMKPCCAEVAVGMGLGFLVMGFALMDLDVIMIRWFPSARSQVYDFLEFEWTNT